MKIYEFNYRKGKIEKNVYEVKETKSMYILENGCFECSYVSRIKKDTIGKMYNREDSYWGDTMYLLADNLELFMKEVIKRKNEKVQKLKIELQEAEENLIKARDILATECLDKSEE